MACFDPNRSLPHVVWLLERFGRGRVLGSGKSKIDRFQEIEPVGAPKDKSKVALELWIHLLDKFEIRHQPIRIMRIEFIGAISLSARSTRLNSSHLVISYAV